MVTAGSVTAAGLDSAAVLAVAVGWVEVAVGGAGAAEVDWAGVGMDSVAVEEGLARAAGDTGGSRDRGISRPDNRLGRSFAPGSCTVALAAPRAEVASWVEVARAAVAAAAAAVTGTEAVAAIPAVLPVVVLEEVSKVVALVMVVTTAAKVATTVAAEVVLMVMAAAKVAKVAPKVVIQVKASTVAARVGPVGVSEEVAVPPG